MLKLRIFVLLIDIKNFFLYTIRGKKTPMQQYKESDPFIYEE